jgi:hypothetical protein
VAAGVVVMHVAAWAGFAGMRAEVAAADDRPRAMTRYARGVAAVEAAGAGLAALLPIGPHGGLPAGVLAIVAVLYGACLIPTLAAARRARVGSTRTVRGNVAAPRDNGPAPAAPGRHRPVPALRLPVGLLAGGALVMLFASGPTLLSVALARQLHGQGSIAGAAAAFSAGCLLSSKAVDMAGRRQLPAILAWPLWGTGMLAGWILAPYHIVGLFIAQFLSGLSMTALEGDMDTRVARQAPTGTVTTALAWSGATRALGSAASVRLVPLMVTAPAIGLASGVVAATLATGGLTTWLLIQHRKPLRYEA